MSKTFFQFSLENTSSGIDSKFLTSVVDKVGKDPIYKIFLFYISYKIFHFYKVCGFWNRVFVIVGLFINGPLIISTMNQAVLVSTGTIGAEYFEFDT